MRGSIHLDPVENPPATQGPIFEDAPGDPGYAALGTDRDHQLEPRFHQNADNLSQSDRGAQFCRRNKHQRYWYYYG